MTDYSKLFADHDASQAGANSIGVTGISPQAAVDAHANAPLTGVPPALGMLDPTGGSQLATQRRNTATLNASPPLTSFVASDPAKAAAVSDDYTSLAGIGRTVARWNDVATKNFFEPGEAAARALVTNVQRYYNGEPGRAPHVLDMIPGFNPQDQKVGSVLADVGALAFSPVSGAVNVAAGAISPLTAFTPQGAKMTPEQRQSSLAGVFGTALMGLGGVRGAEAVRAPPMDEGTFGAPLRLTGPKEVVLDAEFHDIAPPGVNPQHTDTYTAIAGLDAEHTMRMQEAVAESATHSRSPQLMLDFLENHTEAGGQTVAVPPEALTKLWAEGHSVFPSRAGDIADALSTGTDVQVPLAEYLTETAGKPFAEELNAATRFREGGVSVEEAKGLPSGETEAVPPREVTPPEDIEPELHPAVREIAARADNAVSQVFKETALDSLFTNAKAAGMTEGQFARYAERVDEARANTHARLLERTYNQIRRERTPEFKAAVDLHTEAARNLIESQPNVKAYRALRDPLFKLDSETVADQHPDLTLPAGLTKRGGLAPDEAAELTGHASGAELVADLHHLHNAVEAGGGTLDKYIANRAKEYATTQARADLGYDVTPEGLLAAAREALVEPGVEALLTEDLRDLAQSAGLPFSKEDTVALAQEQFGQLHVSDALKPKAFAENMRRLGAKAESALMDEKPVEAFKRKQQQLMQYLQMKEAFKFQKEFAKTDKAMRVVGRKPINKGMDQIARNHLRAQVERLGYPVRSGKFENVESALKGQTLEEYGKSLNARGQPVYIAEPYTGPASGMLVDTWRDQANMFNSIATIGRQEMTVEADGKRQRLADIAQQIADTATVKVGRRFTAAEVRKRTGLTFTESLVQGLTTSPSARMRQLGAMNTRNETALYWLDGETFGPLMEHIVTPLNRSAGWKIQQIQAIGRAFMEFAKGQPKGWEKSLSARVNVPELTFSRTKDGRPVSWMQDRGNLIVAALHSGTEDNWAKLTEGYGWEPTTVKAVLDRELTEADWKYVQFLWDQAAALWPKTQALYRDTVGLAPKEIPGRSVPTPFGELRGAYWHLRYDWGAVGENAGAAGEEIPVTDPMALGTSDLFGDQFQVATPPNGSSKQRTQYRGPLDLSHDALHRDFEAVLHDLAFRKELINAAKLLRQAPVRQAIREALGPEWLRGTEQWLKDIAQSSNYDRTVMAGLTGWLRGARRNFTIAQVGFNMATVIKHGGIAASHMIAEGGAQLPSAISDLLWNGKHWSKFIDANSVEVPNTLFNLDRDVREAMEESFRQTGHISKMQYYSTVSFAIVKRMEAQATWLAKYRQLTSQGTDDTTAFALADKSVRDTQGSGTTVNLSAFNRGDGSLPGEAFKWLNVFTTFMNTQTNRMWTMSRRTERMMRPVGRALGGRPIAGYQDEGWAGARRDFVRNVADLHAYVLIPAMWTTLVDILPKALLAGATGAVIYEEFKKHFGEHAAEGALGGSIPLGTTVAQIPKMWHRKKFEAPGDALSESMTAIGQTAFNASEFALGEDVKDNLWPQHLMDTAGYVTGYPTKPASRLGQFWWDRERGAVSNDTIAAPLTALTFGNSAARDAPTGRGRRGRR